MRQTAASEKQRHEEAEVETAVKRVGPGWVGVHCYQLVMDLL